LTGGSSVRTAVIPPTAKQKGKLSKSQRPNFRMDGGLQYEGTNGGSVKPRAVHVRLAHQNSRSIQRFFVKPRPKRRMSNKKAAEGGSRKGIRSSRSRLAIGRQGAPAILRRCAGVPSVCGSRMQSMARTQIASMSRGPRGKKSSSLTTARQLSSPSPTESVGRTKPPKSPHGTAWLFSAWLLA